MIVDDLRDTRRDNSSWVYIRPTMRIHGEVGWTLYTHTMRLCRDRLGTVQWEERPGGPTIAEVERLVEDVINAKRPGFAGYDGMTYPEAPAKAAMRRGYQGLWLTPKWKCLATLDNRHRVLVRELPWWSPRRLLGRKFDIMLEQRAHEPSSKLPSYVQEDAWVTATPLYATSWNGRVVFVLKQELGKLDTSYARHTLKDKGSHATTMYPGSGDTEAGDTEISRGG